MNQCRKEKESGNRKVINENEGADQRKRNATKKESDDYALPKHAIDFGAVRLIHAKGVESLIQE